MVRDRHISKLRWRAVSEIADAAAATRGRRFRERYEQRAARRDTPWKRSSRVLLAGVLFAIGIANAFIPGPGGSVFIFASALVLAGESRTFATFLDQWELRNARRVDWMLRHPVRVGGTISVATMIAVALVGYAVSRVL